MTRQARQGEVWTGLRRVLARTDRALREGVRDLEGGDAALVLKRLQGATHGGDALPDGRARECYDTALRCLEEAGAFPRVEGKLRREAAGWLRAAREEGEGEGLWVGPVDDIALEMGPSIPGS